MNIEDQICFTHMKLEDQVCTAAQGIILRSYGIIQDHSLFDWYATLRKFGHDGLEWKLDPPRANRIKDKVSAFTLAELGLMLPHYSNLTTSINRDGLASCKFAPVYYGGITAPTEAQARAEMLIELIKTNKISRSEVNQRLRK